MTEDEIRKAFVDAAGDELLGLGVRGLRDALKTVHVVVTSDEAIAMLQKYDERSAGELDLRGFTRLVQEFHAFANASAGGGGARGGVSAASAAAGGGGGGGGGGGRGGAAAASSTSGADGGGSDGEALRAP